MTPELSIAAIRPQGWRREDTGFIVMLVGALLTVAAVLGFAILI
jgi:hypothetical protein